MPTSTKAFDGGRVGGIWPGVASAVEVDLVWNITGSKVVKNVLHGRAAGAPTVTAAIAQAIYAAIIASAQWTAYKPYVNSGCAFAGVYLKDLSVSSKPYVLSTGGPTAGTGAALALPAGVSACISFKTAGAGRGFRGRAYLPGLDSSALNTTTGNFLAAFQTAAQNFMTEVETAMSASGFTHCLLQAPRQAYIGRTGIPRPLRLGGTQDVTQLLMRLLTPTSQRRRSYVA